jgi:hypothetical protein
MRDGAGSAGVIGVAISVWAFIGRFAFSRFDGV